MRLWLLLAVLPLMALKANVSCNVVSDVATMKPDGRVTTAEQGPVFMSCSWPDANTYRCDF